MVIAFPLVAAFAAGATSDVGLLATLRFGGWTIGWWFVGLIAVASFKRPPRNRFTLVTYAGVLGIIAQLMAWAIFVSLDAARWLPAALPGVLIATLLWPAVRRNLRACEPGRESPAHERMPSGAFTAWAAGASALMVMAAAFFRVQTLPPRTSAMYQDLYWHLGIAADLKRQVLPSVVEAHTGRLNYHWLSDAYMAAGSLGAHVGTEYVVARLWMLPILLLSPALLVAVGHQISGSWSGSWLAVLITTCGLSTPVLSWQSLGPSMTYWLVSPSQVFGVPMMLFAVSLMVFFLRTGQLNFGGFVVFTFVGFICAGSKSSILPTLIGGTASLLLATAFRRSPHAQTMRRIGSRLLLAELAALMAALPLFAGGSAGSKVRILGHLRRWDVVIRVTHHPHELGHGPFLPPGLSVTAVAVFLGLLLALLLSYSLGGFSLLLGRHTWVNDPIPMLLTAAFLSSVAAFLVIDHTGMSESYFPMGAMPLLALLASWGWAHAWDAQPHSSKGPYAVSLAAGVAIAAAFSQFAPHRLPGSASLSAPTLMLWLGGPLLVASLCYSALWVARRRKNSLLCMLSILIGFSAFTPACTFIQTIASGLAHVSHRTPASVLPDEATAASWVRDHTPSSAIIATNVHCLFVIRSSGCISGAYWTSGLMERQMFIGSWGYTDAAQRNSGKNGHSAVTQDFPDAAAFRLNEAMFYAPSAATAQQLRARGVRYLYADSRVTPLSPHIVDFAHPVYSVGTVTVYQLNSRA